MEYVSTEVEADKGDVGKLSANDQALVGRELAVVVIGVQELQYFLDVLLREGNQTGSRVDQGPVRHQVIQRYSKFTYFHLELC